MHVRLLDYTSGDERVLGLVRSTAGVVSYEGDIPERVKDTIAFERSRTKVSDGAFLLKLQRVFSGSYLRAQFVK